MIQLPVQGFKNRGDVGEVPNPTLAFDDRPGYVYGDVKGVTMQPPAFVIRREIGQVVGRLDGKLLENVHNRVSIFPDED